MKLLSVLVIFLTVSQTCARQKAESTLNVHARVALLKFQIAQEIKSKQFATEKMPPINNLDDHFDYEYETNNAPITPINENDKRKKHDKFKLRQLKTTTTKLWKRKVKKKKIQRMQKKPEKAPPKEEIPPKDVPSSRERKNAKEESSSSENDEKYMLKGINFAFSGKDDKNAKGNAPVNHEIRPLRNKKHKKKFEASDNTFYRRYAVDPRNLKREWIHCTELISPFLAGLKTNMTSVPKITPDDHNVVRLIQLMSEDTTNHTKDEILSILYQISNLQIRLFQWDVQSLRMLLGVISREKVKVYTFKHIKEGLKQMFEAWHLDIGNTTTLLKQARIFRPPCVRCTDYGGSTKTSKGIRYSSKTDKSSCVPRPDAEDSGDCY